MLRRPAANKIKNSNILAAVSSKCKRSKIFQKSGRNWQLEFTFTVYEQHFLAAPGHINYAKCAWVYERFTVHGFHAIRRTDRFWVGIWSDLAIEQVPVRSLKSRGGLTRGGGITESIRLI